MKIAYYCQQVLGVGHFHRSLQICRAFSRHHQVTMITGGAPLQVSEEKLDYFQLPGLIMDHNFHNLTPCDAQLSLDQTKALRAKALMNFFASYRPQIFLVELYPFGRKAFRFELDPLLTAIKDGSLHRCLVLCSLRDILVERHDRKKFEARVIATLNHSFDGLLIHGDKSLIPLETTFDRVDDIAVPLAYTGYVTPQPAAGARDKIRRELGLGKKRRLIIASIGGGNVGLELLHVTIKACALLADESLTLMVFAGPYASSRQLLRLREKADARTSVERFSPRFSDMLAAADLSISMAGYNTTMNVLAAGTPALLYPFSQNQEQRLRLKALEGKVPLSALEEADLTPAALARRIQNAYMQQRFTSPIALDGAVTTAALVQNWHHNGKVKK